MSLRPLTHGLGLLFLLAAVAGCGSRDESAVVQLIGEHGQEIQGGYEDPNDSGVVGVLHYAPASGAFGMCSGTLIAPNVVLTARHCVSNTLSDQGGVYCPETKAGSLFPATTMFVTTQPEFTQDGDAYHPAREVIGLPVDSPLFCGNDQAILILDQPITPEEALPYTPRVDVPLYEGEEYYAVGFGAINDNGSGSGTRRRRDGLFIDCVSQECPDQYVKETEWVGDTGICTGDSGGPAMDLMNRAIGVTSRGSVGCDSPVYGYVFGWAQWIKDTTIYAAGLGGYPVPLWATGWPTDPAYSAPIGDACTQPGECASNHCVIDAVGGYCSRPCNLAAPCPEGWMCDEANLQVCVQVPPPPEVPEEKADSKGRSGADAGGCSVGGEDPTKPIPWKGGAAAALIGLALLARRRQR
jgi:MYXO-CTERM domain-containing protein